MKKLKSLLMVCVAICFNTIVGGILANALGLNPVNGAIALNIVGIIPQLYKWYNPQNSQEITGVLREGLYKEIWIQGVMDGFYPDGSWLSKAEDVSMYVENESINLAELGITPEVYKNWDFANPVPTVVTNDVHHNKPLERFDTQNTRIKNKDKIETSYDAVKAYMRKHQLTLQDKSQREAIFNFCPTTHSANTPILATTGANNGRGFKRLTFEDLISFGQACNDMDLPDGDRNIVLSNQHLADLQTQDLEFFKSLVNLPTGVVFSFNGFTFFNYSKTPLFNKNTGAKLPFGAVQTTDMEKASVFFIGSEVLRADGEVGIHYRDEANDPEFRADTMGTHKRGLYLPKRNKFVGALYSVTA